MARMMSIFNKNSNLSFHFILLIIGIVYWISFYSLGNPQITHEDWLKEQMYLDTLRNALSSMTIPWIWDTTSYTVKPFMAIAEVTTTPDIFLLLFLSNKTYIVAHHCLLFILGCLVLFKINEELKLEKLSFIFLFIIFNFNGYITSHIAEGHFQWTGYYIIPWVMYSLYKLEQTKGGSCFWSILLGMLIGFLFLNGSLHIAIWCLLFVAIFVFFSEIKFTTLMASFVIAFGIGAAKIIPALFYFPPFVSAGFLSGYTDFPMLLNALTQLKSYDNYGALGWWEYSIYIGFTAFFLLFIGFYLFIKDIKIKLSNPWLIASFLILLFSLGNTWGVFPALKLPFLNVERVASRFIILPFFILLIASSAGINRMLISVKGYKTEILFIIFISMIIVDLYYQFKNWNLGIVQQLSGGAKSIGPIPVVGSEDNFYKLTVYTSWCVSLLTMVFSGFLLKKSFK